MKLSIGDFIDRYTILTLKREHLGDEVFEEWQAFKDEFIELDIAHPEWHLSRSFRRLQEVNAEIWGFEADLRLGQLEKFDTSKLTHLPKEKLLQLAAVGLSAIQIRNTNRTRKQIINELIDLTGEGYKEVKVNHSSEEIIV